MRIDSAILTNAIITSSEENPLVSGSSQVSITATTGYSTFSSSIQTYTNAKVAGLVDSAPGTLDTLNELAAALGDDPDVSASFATTVGTKLPTATHNTYSGSSAGAIRTEYKAGDTALSSSAHTQREAIKGLATTANNSLSGSSAGALRTEYVASTSALSASAHTRRNEISASLDATIDSLDSLGISTDTERGALSSSAHTQREAIKGLATTANNSLSGSSATALRAEYVAGDTALSSSAEVRRNQLHALQLLSSSVGGTINDSAVKLSGIEAAATADQSNAEIVAAVEAGTDSNTFTDADHSKLNAIEASADVTDTSNVTSAGALMDSEVTNLAQVKAFDSSDYIASASHGAKLNAIEAGADVTDATNVTAAGALMDSEIDANLKTFALPASTTISAFGKTIVDDASAAAVRTTIGVDASGTDNSTDVTLGGGADYITISGQTITVDPIDISDDTNFAVSDTTGQTGINLTLTGDTVSGVVVGLDTDDDVTFNDVVVAGNLTVQGTRTEIQAATLNVEDLNITVASGSADSAAANGAGLTVAGAGATILYTHGTTSWDLNKPLNVTGNIGVSGTVDGRDVATDGTKLDGIEASATADQSNAEIVAAVEAGTDSNTFTDADHTKLNGIAASATATVDLTVDGAGTVHANNYTNTTYSAGNSGLVPAAGSAGEFLKHDGTFGTPSYTTNTDTNTVDMGDGFKVRDDDNDDVTLTENTYIKFVSATGTAGTNLTGAGTTGDPFVMTITSPDTDTNTNTQNSAATIRTLIGSGNNGHVPTEGSAGEFLKHDGTFGTPSYTTNTNTQNSRADLNIDTDDNVAFEGLMVGQTTGAVANTIRCTGDIVAYYSSDKQFKDNIVTLDGALDKVKQIRGVEFDWNDKQEVHEGHDIGVIAQEVEAVYPDLVHHRAHDDSKAVDYVKLTAVLIEAVKELSAKVEKLENK